MEATAKLGLPFVLIALAAAAGCGGGGEAASAGPDPLAGYPKGPTREFIVPGGDNAVPTYGREATVAEREQASAVIQKWMRARAATDFVEECRYFSRSYINSLVDGDAAIVSEGKVKTCPQALAYFGPEASGDFKNTLSGPIDSLRVPKPGGPSEPDSAVATQGFAQYHGRDGIDYQIPMNRERERWRVAATVPINQEG